jgi:hypothetical protein
MAGRNRRHEPHAEHSFSGWRWKPDPLTFRGEEPEICFSGSRHAVGTRNQNFYCAETRRAACPSSVRVPARSRRGSPLRRAPLPPSRNETGVSHESWLSPLAWQPRRWVISPVGRKSGR